MERKEKDNKTEGLPEGWERIKLGDDNYFQLIMGQSPPSSSYNKTGLGIPFLQGNAEFGNVYPHPTIFCDRPLKIAEKGDILLSVRAPVGEVNIATEKCCIGRGVGAIRAQKNVDSQFLFYRIQNLKQQINSMSGGSTFKAITKKQLENFEIVIPPFSEQKCIAEILSDVDDSIAKVESEKQKREKIKKGLMNDLLSGKKRVKI